MKSNNPFLSIVIPVYNGANTVRRCLDSIWNQDIDEELYEVICVNDCSKDKTLDVLEEIQKEHFNLRVLSNAENLRAGGGRNYGVREARGEYILFIDADDYYHDGALKEAVKYLQNHELDILMCDSSREMPNKPSNVLVHNCCNKSVMTGRDFLLANGYPLAPWKFFFKRDLMIANQCFFEEKVQAEDVDWVYRIGLLAKRMQYLPILLVHYVLEKNSLSANSRSERNIKDTIFCGNRLYQMSMKYKENDGAVYCSIRNLAVFYLTESVKMMHLVSLPISVKVKLVSSCKAAQERTYVSFVVNNPKLFAVYSNVFAPVLSVMLYLKRKIKGRM